jgi:HAD superfamily hydrolase (TIGR01509 family)
VIFDVDGTLADTERDGHRRAFNLAFAAHGLDIHWGVTQYGRLLRTAGGRERIAGFLRDGGCPAADELATEIHRTKTELFRASVLAGAVLPRPGLPELVSSLREAGIRIAVATTGRRAWVEPLVRQLLGVGTAETLVAGDDVARLKPDPEVYLRALAELDLAPQSVLAVEDSQVGLRAALGAGLATVVVTNDYTADQDFAGAAGVRRTYAGTDALSAAGCIRLHQHWWSVPRV